MKLKEQIDIDLFRFNRKKGLVNQLLTAIKHIEFRQIALLRWYKSGRLRFLSRFLLRYNTLKTGIQIGYKTKIGSGFVIVHFGTIAINNEAVIGNNCTIYPGVVVGMSFRGGRRGNPKIGNNVWIGANAVVVGNVTIGDDVLIAPLSYVNFDVPAHSIVIGNPAKIISRDSATEGYINNTDYK